MLRTSGYGKIRARSERKAKAKPTDFAGKKEEAKKHQQLLGELLLSKNTTLLYHILCHHSVAFEIRPIKLIQRPMGWEKQTKAAAAAAFYFSNSPN
jgi:hypothetical protein